MAESSNTTTNNKKTALHLINREKLELDGIQDVLSFDEMSIYLITENGNLLVEGNDLHITTLDVVSGNLIIEGFVRSMVYNDKETNKKGGFFSRIIK